jgi:uncharacterized protein YqeY
MERNVVTKKIQKELIDAVKAKDKTRISTLRMLLSNLKNAELEEREELTEEQEMAILASYARRCKDSIDEFRKGGREDLVAKETAELEIVMTYLPEQLSDEQVKQEAKKVIEELGAAGPQDMGKVMSEMMKRFKGKVEGRVVSRLVSEMLKKG